MRVGITFHTFDPYLSGVDYYTLGLIRSLLKIPGMNVVVFTNALKLFSEHVPDRINLHVRPVVSLNNRLRRIFWEHIVLPKLAYQEKLDLLHCPCYVCPILPSSIATVVTVHDTIALDYPRWCKLSNSLYYNLMLKQVWKRADQLIAVSQSTASDIERHCPELASKISVNSPGVDSIFSMPMRSVQLEQIRTRYQLPQRFLLYVGNLEPKKNLINLLKAYRILRQKNFSGQLVVVGQRCWNIKHQLKQSLEHFQPDDILFTGYVPRCDLPGVYQLAQLFLFPSLYEGFGFPALEAMASGVPVIASNRGALAETVANAACRVDPENPHQIAEAVGGLWDDSIRRQHFIEQGQQQCQKFNWEHSTNQILNIYYKSIDAKENRLHSNHLALSN